MRRWLSWPTALMPLQDDVFANQHASRLRDKVKHYTTSIQSTPYDDQAYIEELHRSLDTIQFKILIAGAN